VSAHPASQRRSFLSALVARVEDYVFEPIEPTVEPAPAQLAAHPVVAVVSATPRSGATTVARLLAAELGARADGAAVVTAGAPARRAAPPARATIRLSTALAGAGDVRGCGRVCVAATPAGVVGVVTAARYLAPVVLDLPPDGSAFEAVRAADHVVVVAAASGEPALLDAVATVIGGHPVRAVNRVTEAGRWERPADVLIPDSRLGARAAAVGARAIGPVGRAIGELADALERGEVGEVPPGRAGADTDSPGRGR
jgi:hypothetical protein